MLNNKRCKSKGCKNTMKKMVNVTEVEGEGLVALLGENVILFCANYFYAGKLVGVNKDDVLLEEASIVYETGELCAKTWKDAQKLPADLYVRTSMIESYCKSGR
jgi:hypothetical protein